MPNKILVTGASGFLGKAVVHRLKKNREYEVLPIAGRAEWDLTKQKQFLQQFPLV